MMIYLGRISPEASKMKKSVEEFLYEYVVIYQGDEIVTFYSDSAPPHVGTLLSPWEFVSHPSEQEESQKDQTPYRIVEVNWQPKKMNDSNENISTQMRVQLTD